MGANLQVANLGYYDRPSTEFFYANLAGAVLRNTDLATAVLSGADLTDEGIRGAILQRVFLRNVNLTEIHTKDMQ